jgi:hypothetical protein
MCQRLYAEVYPRECEGCGQPYVRGMVNLGHTTGENSRRTLWCTRPGCGHIWVTPPEQKLRPVLRRCTNRRCPTWHTAEPPRQPFPDA